MVSVWLELFRQISGNDRVQMLTVIPNSNASLGV